MDIGTNSSPMRWPKGPYWTQPAALDLIQGTPLDCLILPWGASDTQAGQFQALLAAGKERGIAFAGLLGDGVNPSDAIPSARTAGLSALATAKPESVKGFPVIPWVSRSKVAGLPAGPVAAFTDNSWPSVKTTKRFGRDVADAGPTGVPWIDSNGWFVQMARTLLPERSVWISADPPGKQVISRPDAYILAASDAAFGGARWVVSLDDDFAGALASGDAKSLAAWKKVTRALAFFESHRDWQTYRSLGLVGVVSNFSGDNEFFSTEALNLIGRRQLPYRILEKSKMPANALEGLKAVVYADEDLPTPGVRQALLGFVRAGGLLVCLKKCAALAAGGTTLSNEDPEFDVFQLGSGRVAVCTEDAVDPYLLANKTHMLLSRKNDLFHTYSAGACASLYTGTEDGRKALFQLLMFSSGANRNVSIEMSRPCRAARFWTLDSEGPAPLELVRRESSQELHLPQFSSYCAIELEA